MDKLWPTLIIVAVTVVVFAAMWWGWRRRSRRDAPLRATRTVPARPGAERVVFDAFYVATTQHDRPLERVAIDGLGFRARAHVTVHDTGVTLTIPGQPPVFIAADTVSSLDRATATIDRVVEPGGLLRLAWRVPVPGDGATVVDTYLRPIQPEAAASFIEAVRAIAPHTVIDPTASSAKQRKRGAA